MHVNRSVLGAGMQQRSVFFGCFVFVCVCVCMCVCVLRKEPWHQGYRAHKCNMDCTSAIGGCLRWLSVLI